MEPRFLIIETSGRAGQTALAQGKQLLACRHLDETRRHARDLAPAVRELLAAQGWSASAIDAVIVSRGPGSYTGLRVGVMSAKAFAYAVGCSILAIDTFAAIARQAAEAQVVEVIADAQQDRVYCQRFARSESAGGWQAETALSIRPFAEWQASVQAGVAISGPGVRPFAARLPSAGLVAAEQREPHCDSLLQLGLERFLLQEADDVWNVEPLYLRPSAAEQQWQGRAEREAAGAKVP